MRFTLISGRSLAQAKALEIGKSSSEYLESVATAFLSEKDMDKLSLKDGDNVELKTLQRSVVLKCKKASLEEGLVFSPYGPWINLIVGKDTKGTGMPESKGFEIEIEKSNERVLSLQEIADLLKGD
ncbi:MAG: molybdopterin dinucleotide binding domain-containing protein [Candidatus Methanofastidiosia archaeon]